MPGRPTDAGRILVVDDEEQIRLALARALTARNYVVEARPEAESALRTFDWFRPDLVVLDLNLPGMDGLEVCRRLRATSDVPILILSVREEEADKVEALNLGADDYLTKPFGIEEFLARIRALLRRAGSAATTTGTTFREDGLEIDLEQRTVRRAGKDERLTKTEWALLDALSRHPGKLLTHRWLLERVWGPGYEDDVDVLRVFVSQLRKKIEPDPSRPRIVVTDPGVGYRWTLRPGDGGNAPVTADTG
ncbi:MAG TPA: response regulator transcription factor [Actinomycetota bacterium]|nr:response regulator transcription factor [Actinomycetota bacterium]